MVGGKRGRGSGYPCLSNSCRIPLSVVESGQWWTRPGSATSSLSGWGIEPNKIWFSARRLSRKRAGRSSNAWMPAVSATWAWVDQRVPARVHRRSDGSGSRGRSLVLFFRPVQARREPIWADSRLLVTPRPGGQGNQAGGYRRAVSPGRQGTRQGVGDRPCRGSCASGFEVAHPTTANGAARA